ncbi:TetR family transcriptional regulator [Williamsia limnetica]|uniref:TetR family transcriptional regulator n=1 Tax=Williamsia limnetica TaxID=882452 RepID=A0A318RP70_WILLI|nr:TetR/AcrR family transcriptional regulator [Williamsia limnetica]PYE18612.1 TetR family transcriptional regulator [Williamsia limnetica]
MAAVVRPYRGVAAQTRRDQRREQLLQSCLDLVAESGATTITVDSISARAGLSKRYFYESFRDRDAILVEAIDDVLGPLGTALVEQLPAELSTDERIAHVASSLVKALTADPRAAYLYTSASGNTTLEARRRQIVDELTPLLMTEVLGTDPDNPRDRASTILMVAGATELLDRWLRDTLALTEDEFIETLTALGQRLVGPI